VHDVDARQVPLERAPELQRLWKGIWDAEVVLEPIAPGYTFDAVTVDLLVTRAPSLSPAAEDGDVVAAVGEPTGEDLDEALDAPDVRAEVGRYEQEASVGERRQIPLAVEIG
jgi:hypothetical protein